MDENKSITIDYRTYEHLREKHSSLIWYILGPDYYTISMDIHGSITESTNAIIEEYKRIKQSRDNYKKLSIALVIILLMIGITMIANL